MRYLIQSQNAENLQKVLAYAESLGIEIKPLPEENTEQKKASKTFKLDRLITTEPTK